MKLLRLTTESPDCLFNTYFNEELEIEANSQIALENASFITDYRVLTIDGRNDGMEFNLNSNQGTAAAQQRTVAITHGTYNGVSDAGADDPFLTQLRIRTNAALLQRNQSKEIGAQWNVTTVGGKVNFVFRRALYTAVFDDPVDPRQIELSENLEAQLAGNIYSVVNDTGLAVDVDDLKLYPDLPFIKGCGVFRFKLSGMTTPVDGTTVCGGMIGLSLNTSQTWAASTDMEQHAHVMMRLFNDAGTLKYKEKHNGVTTTLNLGPANVGAGGGTKDEFEICIEGGQLIGRVYRNGQATINCFTVPYNGSTNLYPFGVLNDAAGFFYNPKIQLDPFSYNWGPAANTGGSEVGETSPALHPTADSTVLLKFGSFELAEYLGFPQQQNTVINVTDTCTFEATHAYTPRVFNDSFIVELLNLKIDSYDSFLHQRANILKVIPSSSISTQGIVDYETSNINFIDINNSERVNLRNIKCRVLRNDWSTINVRGLSVLTLLVKGPDKK